MDEHRFDQLTRSLCRLLPRRRALPLVAGGTLGLLFEKPVVGEPTLGKRRCGRRRCKPRIHVCFKKRCRAVPVAGKPCFSDGLPCRNGATCVATGLAGQEVCTCLPPLSACGVFPNTECVDLHSDPSHCGSCLNQCLLGVTSCCSVGPLEPGECVDTQTDPRHCGRCGRSCGSGERCLGGQCASRCRAGLTLCDEACIDTDSDLHHCGRCGNACASGQSCVNGQCQGTACANDGEACEFSDECCLAPASVCNNGVCRNRCRPGFTYCGNCVNLATDPANCGRCGQSCGAGGTCANGQCQGCVPYGGSCASSSDCCLLTDGSHIPCNGGLCRFS